MPRDTTTGRFGSHRSTEAVLEPDDPAAVDQAPVDPPTEPESTRARRVTSSSERLSVPLTTDGAPDWDRMHDGNKRKLRAILRREAKTPAKSIDAEPSKDSLLLAAVVVGSFDTIELLILRGAKVPIDIAKRIAPLSADEKNGLSPSVAKLIAKYTPDAFNKWADEIAVLFLLGQATTQRLTLAREMMAGPERHGAAVAESLFDRSAGVNRENVHEFLKPTADGTAE